MSIELRVSTGARAGHREAFDGSTISLGRDPLCDLRLDASRDLDVSARHAEIAARDGGYHLRDLGSTNGTFVNGVRVTGSRALRDGDVVMLGADGPKIIVTLGASRSAGSSGGREEMTASSPHGARGDVAPGAPPVTRRGPGGATLLVAAAALVTVLAVGGTYALGARAEGGDDPVRSIAVPDYPAIAAANGAAVVLIAVEMDDGRSFTGSGFGIRDDGLVITNRHLLESPDGASLRRIAVIYSDTRSWLPARIVTVHETDDLALLRVDRDGPFPVIAGIAAVPAVGAPVAIIGYPLGIETPMDGPPDRITARATLGAGMVSKVVNGVLQIDAFAGEGSSGSPVFDASGKVVGVVYGGARASAGRIVYAVPGDRVTALLAQAKPGAAR